MNIVPSAKAFYLPRAGTCSDCRSVVASKFSHTPCPADMSVFDAVTAERQSPLAAVPTRLIRDPNPCYVGIQQKYLPITSISFIQPVQL